MYSLFQLYIHVKIYSFVLFVLLQCIENKELQERITLLEQQLAAANSEKSQSSSGQNVPEEYINELRKKIQMQVISGSNSKLEGIISFSKLHFGLRLYLSFAIVFQISFLFCSFGHYLRFFQSKMTTFGP